MARTDKRDLSLKRVVDAIRPTTTRFRVWDAELKGFGLDVRPPDPETGAAGGRTWILNYRFHGRQRRMALGSADIIPPDQARKAAQAAWQQINQGTDPLAVRRGVAEIHRARHASVAEVAERYLATLEARGSATWAREAARIYTAHIAPGLGRVAARDVAVKDARAMHERMVKTPIAANRTKAVLSAILTRAIEDGDRPRELLNPAAAVPDYPEPERDRYLTEDEWPRVAKAIKRLRTELADIPAWDTRGAQLDALLTLALTGARLRSVLPRKWTDVDWSEHALVVSPAHKGVTRILIGEAAEQHLRFLFDARGGEGFIFPGQQRRVGARTARYGRDTRPERAPSSVSSLAPVWNRLQELASLEDFTLHDWRRTYATVAGDVGISDHMIGGLLSHAVPGIRRRYARRTDTALLEAATKVSVEIAARLGLRAERAAKITPLPVKRRSAAS